MAWKPEPSVEDCRKLARKWGQEQIIVIALDGAGRMKMATYGESKALCDCAWVLGQTAFSAIQAKVNDTIEGMRVKPQRRITFEDPPEEES